MSTFPSHRNRNAIRQQFALSENGQQYRFTTHLDPQLYRAINKSSTSYNYNYSTLGSCSYTSYFLNYVHKVLERSYDPYDDNLWFNNQLKTILNTSKHHVKTHFNLKNAHVLVSVSHEIFGRVSTNKTKNGTQK